MIKTTTNPTSDKDARRFAIYVTNDMLERQTMPVPDGISEESQCEARVNRGPFLEWGLYVLAMRDNFEWIGDMEGDNRLMMGDKLMGHIRVHGVTMWVEKIYDEYWHKLLKGDEDGISATQQRMDTRGRRDGVDGNKNQKRDGDGSRRGIEIRPGDKGTKPHVSGEKRKGVSRREGKDQWRRKR